jgi:hypothetical protein
VMPRLPAAPIAVAVGECRRSVSGFFEEQSAFFPPPDANSDVSISGSGETGWLDFAVC